MTRITRHYRFEAGHRLPHHAGKCRRLHGHSYEVTVEVSGEPRPVLFGDSSSGMVLDFGDLDALVKPVLDGLDHRLLLWSGDDLLQYLPSEHVVVTQDPPTAEYLAEWLHDLIRPALGQWAETLRVSISEGPRSVATYPA